MEWAEMQKEGTYHKIDAAFVTDLRAAKSKKEALLVIERYINSMTYFNTHVWILKNVREACEELGGKGGGDDNDG